MSDVEDRIPEHLRQQRDELLATGQALDEAICEWLDQCELFESAVDPEVYPSLADDEEPSDTDPDVLDATTEPLVVLASAMLLRLSTFGSDQIWPKALRSQGLTGRGLDEHRCEIALVMEYAVAKAGGPGEAANQVMHRLVGEAFEYDMARIWGAKALNLPGLQGA